jgi:DNA invertase Pin-like site-specific DNA recombinase
LSQLRDGEEKASPVIQLESARSKCMAMGWDLDEESSLLNQDLDVSGYTKSWKQRPGLVKHIEDLKAGKFECLVALTFDRLGRNLRDVLDLMKEIEDAGGRIVTVRDGIDTSSTMGKLHPQLMGMLAEFESAQISERVLANRMAQARSGKWSGGRLPMWIQREESGQFSLREPYYSLFKTLASMRIEGSSWRELTHYANALGIKNTSGKSIEMTTLSRILGTSDGIRTLRGEAFVRKKIEVSGSSHEKRLRNRSEITIPGLFPAVISEEQAAQLQFLAKSRPVRTVVSRDRAAERWAANGLIHCVCGSKMRTHISSRPHDGLSHKRTYICAQHLIDPKAEHGPSHVDADAIERAILAPLLPDLGIKLGFISPEGTPNIDSKKALARPKKSIDDIKGQITRLISFMGNSDLADEEIRQRLKTLQAEAEDLQTAKLNVPVPTIRPGLSKHQVREILARMGLRIIYPVTHPSIKLPRSKSPRMCVLVSQPMKPLPDSDRVIWLEWLVPVYKTCYRGERDFYYKDNRVLGGREVVPKAWDEVICGILGITSQSSASQ